MVLGIDTIVTQHLEMFFGDMDDEAFDEVQGGNAFFDGFVIFVPCVVKSNKFTIIFINAGGSNNGTPQVSADVFDGYIRSAGVGLGTDIETIGMIFVDIIFDFPERGTDG